MIFFFIKRDIELFLLLIFFKLLYFNFILENERITNLSMHRIKNLAHTLNEKRTYQKIFIERDIELFFVINILQNVICQIHIKN